jgi:hypothetical protein
MAPISCDASTVSSRVMSTSYVKSTSTSCDQTDGLATANTCAPLVLGSGIRVKMVQERFGHKKITTMGHLRACPTDDGSTSGGTPSAE